MPNPLTRFTGPLQVRLARRGIRWRTMRQFLQFATVGGLGFVIDTATVYALRGIAGLYVAGMAAYVVAASANWALNRVWTFRGRANGALHRQWAMFLLANSAGFALNRGTYATLIAFSPVCRAWPVLAVAAGSLAGMLSNFHLSRKVVFPEAQPASIPLKE